MKIGMHITEALLASIEYTACCGKDKITYKEVLCRALGWLEKRWDSLIYLNLSHNSLTSHLEQLHFHNLEYLELKFNFLQSCLPFLFNLSSFTLLNSSHNKLSNPVLPCIVELLLLDLRRNNFSESLPPLCSLSTSFMTIVLNDNQSEGTTLFHCTIWRYFSCLSSGLIILQLS